MRISKVTLTDYKSFSSTTSLEFTAGTTIIVGKNGSGKSNILEAIRFILPHDKNSADRHCIYEHCESTTVEIEFDNESKRFPAAERFVVKRTLTTKKDEFFLDGRNVTKEELNGLFESAGFMRSNPYYVVPQGAVERLSLMDAEQRHEFVKDVAGATVYERDRVSFFAQLRDTEEAEEKIKSLNEKLKVKIEALRVEQRSAAAAQKIEEEKLVVEKIIAEKELEDVVFKLRMPKKSSVAERETIDCDEIRQKIEKLQNERILLFRHLGNCKNEDVSDDLEKLTKNLLVVEKNAEIFESEKKSIEIEIQVKKLEKAFIESNFSKNRFTSDEIERFENEKELYEKLHMQKEKENNFNQYESVNLTKKDGFNAVSIEQKLRSALQKRKSLWNEQREIMEKIKRGEDDLKRAERNTVAAFGSCFKTIEGLKEEKGVHGCVFELLKIKDEILHAATAVIGSNFYAVVVENDLIATNCIKKINKRVTFIPLNRIKCEEMIEVCDEELLPLHGQIRVEEKYMNLLKFLTRNTYLVSDVKSAVKLMQKYDISVVTVDGEFISKNGIISGGFERRKNAVFEHRKIKENLEMIKSKQAYVKKTISELDEEIIMWKMTMDQRVGSGDEIKSMFIKRKIELCKNWGDSIRMMERLNKEKSNLEIKKERVEIERNRYLNEALKMKIKITELETKRKEIEARKRIEEIEEELKKLKGVEMSEITFGEEVENQNENCVLRTVLMEKRNLLVEKINSLGVVNEKMKNVLKDVENDQLIEKLKHLNSSRREIGVVNQKSISQLKELEVQHFDLTNKLNDLLKSKNEIIEFVAELDLRKEAAVNLTFKMVCDNFSYFFSQIYENRCARLVKEENAVFVEFDGERIETRLLSGGQKTVIALSLLFSVQKIDPSSFYVFDEIDANLDHQTRMKVSELFKRINSTEFKTQFILTTFKSEMLECGEYFIGVNFIDKKSVAKQIEKEDAVEFLCDETKPER